MPNAKIRINPERTKAEFITPEGEEFTENLPSDGGLLTVLGDVDEDSTVYVGAAGEFPGLTANTIYRLVPVRTELETNALIEIDEDDEEADEPESLVGVEDEEFDDDTEGEEEETLPVAHRARK
jgi:hypothetical protein